MDSRMTTATIVLQIAAAPSLSDCHLLVCLSQAQSKALPSQLQFGWQNMLTQKLLFLLHASIFATYHARLQQKMSDQQRSHCLVLSKGTSSMHGVRAEGEVHSMRGSRSRAGSRRGCQETSQLQPSPR